MAIHDRGIFASPFVYPAGRAPGYDTAHIGAGGGIAYIAAVADNAQVFDVGHTIGGKPRRVPQQGGPPTAEIDGYLGPAVNFTAANACCGVAGLITAPANGSAFTFAAILAERGTNPGFIQYIVGGQSTRLAINTTGGPFVIYNNGVTLSSGFTPVQNVPYFVVMSANSAQTNWAVTNLRTGQIRSGTTTGYTSGPEGGASQTIAIGGVNGAARQSMCSIAAVASVYNNFLTQGACQAWAADPWTFWYPRRRVAKLQVGVSAAPSDITGALAAVESGDVANVTGGTVAIGTLAGLELADAANLAATAQWLATLQATEAPDVAAISGPIPAIGSLTAVESSDAGAFAVNTGQNATLEAFEVADAINIAAGVGATATLQAIEAADLAVILAGGFVTVGEVKTYFVTGKRTPLFAVTGTKQPARAVTAKRNTAATWTAQQ